MDYAKIYNSLINRAKNRILEGYQERHHIIPRCLGGSDDMNNIVGLTPEEHYIAHLLLVKIHPNEHKLVYAAWQMQYHNSDHRMNNKTHGWIKRKLSIVISERSKEMWKTNKDKIIKSMILERNTKEGKRRMSLASQARWNSMSEEERIAFKQKMSSINNDELKRIDASNKIKAKWENDIQYQEKMKNRKTRGSDGSALKAKWADPEWRRYMMEARKKKNETN